MDPKKIDEEAVDVPHYTEDKKDGFSDTAGRRQSDIYEAMQRNPSAKLKNPLAAFTKQELFDDVEQFAREKDLMHAIEDLRKGALVAQRPKDFETFGELSDEEKQTLRNEVSPWSDVARCSLR